MLNAVTIILLLSKSKIKKVKDNNNISTNTNKRCIFQAITLYIIDTLEYPKLNLDDLICEYACKYNFQSMTYYYCIHAS